MPNKYEQAIGQECEDCACASEKNNANTRRQFLQKSKTITIGAISLTLLPVALGDETESTSSDETEGTSSGVETMPLFGFLVDTEKCMGSGKCLEACRVENKVPEGQNRTWVERYVHFKDGTVQVDLVPENGFAGSEVPAIDADTVERANSHDGIMGYVYRFLALGSREISEGARAVDDWLIRGLALAGIPIACVLHGYVGFLFGAIKSNPWWSTSLMPVIFLVSAIVSGVAALILLYQFICWWRGVATDTNCIRSLTWYLWIFLVAAVSLETLELGQMAYESGGEWQILKTLLLEHLDVSYGLIQLLIGSICPFFILLVAMIPRLNDRLMAFLSGVASLLVLVQVFAMRWNVVVGGQLFSKSFRGFVEYQVPWVGREGLIATGIILVLPLLALWLVAKFLPIWQDEAC